MDLRRRRRGEEMERSGEKRGENIARKDGKPFCNLVSHTPKLGAARLRLSSEIVGVHANYSLVSLFCPCDEKRDEKPK